MNDVVDVLTRAVFDARMRGNVYNLSNDCTVEALVAVIASGAGFRAPRARLPEWLVRLPVRLLPARFAYPLSIERVSALVSRTSYPIYRLNADTGYKAARSVPDALAEIVEEWCEQE